MIGIKSFTGEIIGVGAITISDEEYKKQIPIEGVSCYLLTYLNDFLY